MKMLNEILGTRYPVIQGGMANIATGAFAAACSEAGALGTIGSGGMNAEQLRKEIEICRKLTDKPFAVNLMLMHPQADEFAKIVAEIAFSDKMRSFVRPGNLTCHFNMVKCISILMGIAGRGRASGKTAMSDKKEMGEIDCSSP